MHIECRLEAEGKLSEAMKCYKKALKNESSSEKAKNKMESLTTVLEQQV